MSTLSESDQKFLDSLLEKIGDDVDRITEEMKKLLGKNYPGKARATYLWHIIPREARKVISIARKKAMK